MAAQKLCFVGHPVPPIDALLAFLTPLAHGLAAARGEEIAVRFSSGDQAVIPGERRIHLRHGGAGALPLLRGAGALGEAPAADAAERGRAVLHAIELERTLDDPASAVARLAELLDAPVTPSVLRAAAAAHGRLRATAGAFVHPAAFGRTLDRLAPVPLPLGVETPVAAGLASTSCLVAGWQVAEDWGVWSRGHHAALGVLVAAPVDPATHYRLRARCMIKPGVGPSFTVDGVRAAGEAGGGDDPVIEVPLGPGRAGPHGLKFLVAVDLASPVPAAPGDGRLVGIGLKSVRIDAVPASAAARASHAGEAPPGFVPVPRPRPDEAPLFGTLPTARTVLALGPAAGVIGAAHAPMARLLGAGWADATAAASATGEAFHRHGPAAEAVEAAGAAGLRFDVLVIDGWAASGLGTDGLGALLKRRQPGGCVIGGEADPDALRTTLTALAPSLRAAGLHITVEGGAWFASSVDDRAERAWLGAG